MEGHKQIIEEAMCSEAKKDECRVALKGLGNMISGWARKQACGGV